MGEDPAEILRARNLRVTPQRRAILAAFAAGDPRAAEKAMRTHIENSRDRLLPAFE